MDKLILENVRCFKGRHEIPLAPLTLLVGENSTGKSTILSAIRLAWDIGKGRTLLDFNEEPFDWGTFEQIIPAPKGQDERAKHFALGIEKITQNFPGGGIRAEAIFTQKDVQPTIEEWKCGNSTFTFQGKISKDGVDILLKRDGLLCIQDHINSSEEFSGFSMLLTTHLITAFASQEAEASRFLAVMNDLFGRRRPFAMAPIRTKPERTYNLLRDTRQSEGKHIPMILSSISTTHERKWPAIEETLNRFGQESGLFSGIQVQKYGPESGPFQVLIRFNGASVNLIDVGYGVSQVLPILIDPLLNEGEEVFLMQQPEVHLHPKAQAALGSYFGSLVSNHRKQMIIETHSDYLIDRVRADVRDGKNLDAKDVILLYFERDGSEVKIYPIELDSAGNLTNAPISYRRFFLEETERILGG